jgi:hypothetical protein
MPIGDEQTIEIDGRLYHHPDCSQWAGQKPELRP